MQKENCVANHKDENEQMIAAEYQNDFPLS
jgi:hypothetical protein